MIWLTWRQFRMQAWVALTALAAITAALAVTAPHLFGAYKSSGFAACRTECARMADSFLRQIDSFGGLYFVFTAALFAAPALIGIFWGAPLVAREFETGTYRLVWNQSLTRTRWLALKLVGVGLASVGTVGLLSLGATWWAGPVDAANQNRILPELFAARGIVPIGYAAFAFVLGVTVGVLIRRTVPAMAVTLVVLVAAALAMTFLVRPHLVTPVTTTTPLDTTAIYGLSLADDGRMTIATTVDQPGAWIVSNTTVTTTGEEFNGPVNPEACGSSATFDDCMAWMDSLQLRQVAEYQPASRFWVLQSLETALLLTLSAILTAFCFWWIRRRLA